MRHTIVQWEQHKPNGCTYDAMNRIKEHCPTTVTGNAEGVKLLWNSDGVCFFLKGKKRNQQFDINWE